MRIGKFSGLTTRQLVDFDSHERVRERRVAVDDRLRKQPERLFKQAVEFSRIEAVEYISNRRLLGGLSASLIRLPLFYFELSQLILQLASSDLESAGDLRQKLVPVFNACSDVSRTVLKFALALKIERIEQNLGNRFRIFLRNEAASKLIGNQLRALPA